MQMLNSSISVASDEIEIWGLIYRLVTQFDDPRSGSYLIISEWVGLGTGYG
jgi:hypothetical protein